MHSRLGDHDLDRLDHHEHIIIVLLDSAFLSDSEWPRHSAQRAATASCSTIATSVAAANPSASGRLDSDDAGSVRDSTRCRRGRDRRHDGAVGRDTSHGDQPNRRVRRQAAVLFQISPCTELLLAGADFDQDSHRTDTLICRSANSYSRSRYHRPVARFRSSIRATHIRLGP